MVSIGCLRIGRKSLFNLPARPVSRRRRAGARSPMAMLNGVHLDVARP